jgi:hypothetical protein
MQKHCSLNNYIVFSIACFSSRIVAQEQEKLVPKNGNKLPKTSIPPKK